MERFNNKTLPNSKPEWVDLSKDLPRVVDLMDRVSTTKHGKLFATVGHNLLDILHGRVDALSLLFEGKLAEDYYQEIFDTPCCRNIEKYLDLLAHKKPGMKIIEVGAGTGEMTLRVLPSFVNRDDDETGTTRCAQYDYTDVSSSYFGNARNKLGIRARTLNFKVLNIEESPVEQGFEVGTYDPVVAGLVSVPSFLMMLPSPPELISRRFFMLLGVWTGQYRTFGNYLNRRHLTPFTASVAYKTSGGKLLLFEILVPDLLRTSFVFGLLPGWWLSTNILALAENV